MLYYREIGFSIECRLHFICNFLYWLIYRSISLTKRENAFAHRTEIRMCLRYNVLIKTSSKQIQEVFQKFNSRFFRFHKIKDCKIFDDTQHF